MSGRKYSYTNSYIFALLLFRKMIISQLEPGLPLLEHTKCTEITVVCVRMVKKLFPINH